MGVNVLTLNKYMIKTITLRSPQLHNNWTNMKMKKPLSKNSGKNGDKNKRSITCTISSRKYTPLASFWVGLVVDCVHKDVYTPTAKDFIAGNTILCGVVPCHY